MPTLTESQIKEIADQLSFGLKSFIHKTNHELLFIPDFDSDLYAEREFYKDELEKLENNFNEYIKIEKPNSSESFEMMIRFIEQLNENEKLKDELKEALNKNKPFRQFKFVIDNSDIHREQWFEFKDAQLKQWVIEKFREATEGNEVEGSDM